MTRTTVVPGSNIAVVDVGVMGIWQRSAKVALRPRTETPIKYM